MEKNDVVIQNGELFGKGRAQLRNEQLIQLIREWEKQRDILLDEISYSRGQVELLEKLVKQSYEKILEVNKEEQIKEQKIIDSRFQELRIVAEAEEEKIRAEDVLIRHKTRQDEIKAGKRKGKPRPSDKAKELNIRKTKEIKE